MLKKSDSIIRSIWSICRIFNSAVRDRVFITEESTLEAGRMDPDSIDGITGEVNVVTEYPEFLIISEA